MAYRDNHKKTEQNNPPAPVKEPKRVEPLSVEKGQRGEIQRTPGGDVLDGGDLQPTESGIVIGPVVNPRRSQAV